MEFELTEISERIEHPLNINIYLKDHQLAMIQKCIEIENNNLCNYGIMNDKPGSGKSYTILAFILYLKLNNIKTNATIEINNDNDLDIKKSNKKCKNNLLHHTCSIM